MRIAKLAFIVCGGLVLSSAAFAGASAPACKSTVSGDLRLHTSFVRGPAIRYILSYSLILATLGAVLRLIYVLTGQSVEILSLMAVMLTLGEMIFLCLFIVSLVWFATRHRKKKWVPEWVGALVI